MHDEADKKRAIAQAGARIVRVELPVLTRKASLERGTPSWRPQVW
jgi:hypothetical protein